MARYSASWRVTLAAPMLPSERYHERSVLTEPLAHASARRTRRRVLLTRLLVRRVSAIISDVSWLAVVRLLSKR
jgi:hypothetical protein